VARLPNSSVMPVLGLDPRDVTGIQPPCVGAAGELVTKKGVLRAADAAHWIPATRARKTEGRWPPGVFLPVILGNMIRREQRRPLIVQYRRTVPCLSTDSSDKHAAIACAPAGAHRAELEF